MKVTRRRQMRRPPSREQLPGGRLASRTGAQRNVHPGAVPPEATRPSLHYQAGLGCWRRFQEGATPSGPAARARPELPAPRTTILYFRLPDRMIYGCKVSRDILNPEIDGREDGFAGAVPHGR